MEANRTVIDNPGDLRSGMIIYIVVRFMKVACKYVKVLLNFQATSSTLSSGLIVI